MTESFLITDIIVIVVLIVVLVLIGVCAFLTHFYWTKIGVAEIWNTAKWSSMRSSFYRTMRRFSRADSSKLGSERPFSAASVYSEADTDGAALPAPLRKKTILNPANPSSNPTNTQPSTVVKNSTTHNNTRRNSGNQIQPVSTISPNKPVRTNYGSKIGQPLENTSIHNVYEHDDNHDSSTGHIEKRRF